MIVYNYTENLIKEIMEYIKEVNFLLMKLKRFNKEIEALDLYANNTQTYNRLVTIAGNIKEDLFILDSKMDSACEMVELYYSCNLISDDDVNCCRCKLDNMITKYRNESTKTLSLIRNKVPDWEQQNYLKSWR